MVLIAALCGVYYRAKKKCVTIQAAFEEASRLLLLKMSRLPMIIFTIVQLRSRNFFNKSKDLLLIRLERFDLRLLRHFNKEVDNIAGKLRNYRPNTSIVFLLICIMSIVQSAWLACFTWTTLSMNHYSKRFL